MQWKKEWKPLILITGIFLFAYYLPIGNERFDGAVSEALHLVKWYAREHVILCLVPAFFIAGAISVFVRQESVMKYLGAGANKILSYGVASVSGAILAVCSCTVLPLFAGIYTMGAGLGPATAFLYSGPAINVLAIILTGRILGFEIGVARAAGAIFFSIIIGLSMHFLFRKEEREKEQTQSAITEQQTSRPLWQTMLYFASMVAILVFANWGKAEESDGFWWTFFSMKWFLTSLSAILFASILVLWFKLSWWKVALAASPAIALGLTISHEPIFAFAAATIGLSILLSSDNGELNEWFTETWGFAKQILPLLLGGTLIAGALLGRPGHEGLIPSDWITNAVGGNSLGANLFASLAGAFMYFATLTEIPILQGLLGSGMGKGPALALLLAGPALSLPSMLVLTSIMGIKKTVWYVLIVVIMSTITGLLYGAFF